MKKILKEDIKSSEKKKKDIKRFYFENKTKFKINL